MTHDYKRYSTTSLFVALELASGKVVGKTYKRHSHQEVVRFLRQVEKAVPKEQDIHIILDNYATHKHATVMDWIERLKRIFLHVTPTSASWLNLVERFYRTLTEKQIHRGVPYSAQDFERCLKDYLETYNENPRPLAWTKSAGEILEKVGRARQALAPFRHDQCYAQDTTYRT